MRGLKLKEFNLYLETALEQTISFMRFQKKLPKKQLYGKSSIHEKLFH